MDVFFYDLDNNDLLRRSYTLYTHSTSVDEAVDVSEANNRYKFNVIPKRTVDALSGDTTAYFFTTYPEVPDVTVGYSGDVVTLSWTYSKRHDFIYISIYCPGDHSKTEKHAIASGGATSVQFTMELGYVYYFTVAVLNAGSVGGIPAVKHLFWEPIVDAGSCNTTQVVSFDIVGDSAVTYTLHMGPEYEVHKQFPLVKTLANQKSSILVLFQASLDLTWVQPSIYNQAHVTVENLYRNRIEGSYTQEYGQPVDDTTTSVLAGELHRVQVTPKDTVNMIDGPASSFDVWVYPVDSGPFIVYQQDVRKATISFYYNSYFTTIRIVVWCPGLDTKQVYTIAYQVGVVNHEQIVTVETAVFYFYNIVVLSTSAQGSLSGIIGEGPLFSQPVVSDDTSVPLVTGLPYGSITPQEYRYDVGDVTYVSFLTSLNSILQFTKSRKT